MNFIKSKECRYCSHIATPENINRIKELPITKLPIYGFVCNACGKNNLFAGELDDEQLEDWNKLLESMGRNKFYR